MKALSTSSRIVLLFLTIVLCVSFSFSINRYGDSYQIWKGLLTDLKLSSYQLDIAVANIYTGQRIDYDGIVDASKKIANINRKLNTLKKQTLAADKKNNSEADLTNSNNQFNYKKLFNYGLGFNQKSTLTSLATINNLILKRHLIVEDFKSNFSVLRNSEDITFHLIQDLQKSQKENVLLVKNLDELEHLILRKVEFPKQTNHDDIIDKLGFIHASYDVQEVNDAMSFVKIHTQALIQRKTLIQSLINQELFIAVQLQKTIKHVEKSVSQAYLIEKNRALQYTYLFGLTAAFALLFAAWQANRVYQLSLKIKKHNDDLEKTVAQRTAYLETTKTNLERETDKKTKLVGQLANSQQKLDSLLNSIDGGVYEYNFIAKKFSYTSSGVKNIWGLNLEGLNRDAIFKQKMHPKDIKHYEEQMAEALRKHTTSNMEYRISISDNQEVWVRDICKPIIENNKVISVVGVMTDITSFKIAGLERFKIEKELAHAQKLESVGQLAAGIAHEINTPAQFISDNLIFLQESIEELFELITDIDSKTNRSEDTDLKHSIQLAIEKADIDYLSKEIPPAVSQSSEGIARVSKIVRAMKDYSHPGESMQSSDINSAIESTITLSSSEWKYFATVKTNLDPNLPLVECVLSDLNQVILNMIINAGHAIVERFDNADSMQGNIVVKTQYIDNQVYIEVSDNGHGMPDDVKSKVFDQFFTTKEVGKGTGQGLSIAYRLIIEKHGGDIEIDSTVGEGTTFRIILPIKQEDRLSSQATKQLSA